MSDNKLLKSINDIDDDLISEAASFTQSKAKKPMRLKAALIAAAAVLVVGIGGVVAVSLSKANVATADHPGIEEVELTCGKYYFNGDVDSGLWFEVTPETISLKGENVDTFLLESIADDVGKELDEINEEYLQTAFEKYKLLYCPEKPYYAWLWEGSDEYPCVISLPRGDTWSFESREEMVYSTGAAYLCDCVGNKIHNSRGDFILVE